MVGLLQPLFDLASVLSTLGLVGALFKPIPGLIGTLQGTANPLIGGLGLPLQLNAQPQTPGNGSNFISFAQNVTSAGVIDVASCQVTYEAAPIVATTFPPFDEAQSKIYRYRQQQMVNLAGWWVLENWLSPSVFACAANNKSSELDVASGWGNPVNAQKALEQHYDTFITEADFASMAARGINTVRMPLAYWHLGPTFIQGTAFEPYATIYANAWERIVNAVNQAGKHGLGVLIDFSGPVGSSVPLPPALTTGNQTYFNGTGNMDRTVAALTYLTDQFAHVTNVVGIELLDNPDLKADLETFYDHALGTLRKSSPNAATFPFYIHDGYDLDRFTTYIANRTDFVVEDHHAYFVQGDTKNAEAPSTAPASSDDVYALAGQEIASAATALRRNLIVGEFSTALPSKALTGPDPEGIRKKFAAAQLDVFSKAASGWGFFTYNKEDCDVGWCFKQAAGNALPAAFSAYPNATQITGANNTDGSANSTTLPQSLTDLISQLTPLDTSALLTQAGEPEGDALAVSSVLSSAPIDVPTLVPTLGKRHRAFHHRVPSRRQRGRVHPRDFPKNRIGRRDLNPEQAAIAQGYDDGFTAAKAFAQSGLSRVGFTHQLAVDTFSVTQSTTSLDPAQMEKYATWFLQGITDAELQVMQALNSTAPASS